MTLPPLHELSAAEAVALLHEGAFPAEALVRACLDRIAGDEPRVLAWQHLDPELALEQARRIDRAPVRPPLGGLPVGVKDIMDTADLPTECGSPIRAGRRPRADAACVAALRAAGAVVLGKTVTTEFATYQPGKTRNPHEPSHTPGGSSSGSAAAVADFMVPAALGTQTAGSIIRPAAVCGVIGYKPTFGLLPLEGVFPLSPSLDTLGIFTRSVEDLSLLAQAMGAHASFDLTPPGSERAEGAEEIPPPRVGICRTDVWSRASPPAQQLVQDAADALDLVGARISEVELPPALIGLGDVHSTIMAVEAARAMAREGHPELLGAKLRALVADGEAASAEAYREALARAAAARAVARGLFGSVDVLITPSTIGEAPEGLGATGDPVFNRIWTLLHVPCVHLPIAKGPENLPLGVQLIGPSSGDAALLRIARWAWERLRP